MTLRVRQKDQGAAVIPDGLYPATLMGVRKFTNAYGERIGFEFCLHGGEVEGEKVMLSTATNLSPRSKLADVLRGLLGRDLTDGELRDGLDLEELVGTACRVVVGQQHNRMGHAYPSVLSTSTSG